MESPKRNAATRVRHLDVARDGSPSPGGSRAAPGRATNDLATGMDVVEIVGGTHRSAARIPESTRGLRTTLPLTRRAPVSLSSPARGARRGVADELRRQAASRADRHRARRGAASATPSGAWWALLVTGDAVPRRPRSRGRTRRRRARERKASTAVLEIGVGVPHARLAGLRDTVVALGLSRAGLYEPVPTMVVRAHRGSRAVAAGRHRRPPAHPRGDRHAAALADTARRSARCARSGDRAPRARSPRALRSDRLNDPVRSVAAGRCDRYHANRVGSTNPRGAGAAAWRAVHDLVQPVAPRR